MANFHGQIGARVEYPREINSGGNSSGVGKKKAETQTKLGAQIKVSQGVFIIYLVGDYGDFNFGKNIFWVVFHSNPPQSPCPRKNLLSEDTI